MRHLDSFLRGHTLGARLRSAVMFTTLVLVGLWALPVHALTGADVAYLVNQRYQSSVTQCALNRPAWMCSGVLMRALPGDASQPFAQLTAQELALQSANVAYLRHDLRTSGLATSAGFILADGLTAAGWGKPLDVRCAYPVAVTPAAATASHGCDLLTMAAPSPPDLSSCLPNGVTDAPGWAAHFTGNGSDVNRQCSFSAMVAKQFKASLDAHALMSDALASGPNNLLVTAWDVAKPETIPVQAFFYDVSHGGQLIQAQRYQKQYFDATGTWVPILRMGFGPPQGATYGFDETDQLDEGFRIAARLNARYADVSPTCPGGRPAFYCNGVIVRIAEASAAFHAWNASPSSVKRDGVSFSYLRADAGVKRLIEARGGTGFVVRESGAPTGYPLTVRCAFPSDGFTGRLESCYRNDDHRFCDEMGVTTVAAWQTHYLASSLMTQCPFRPDAVPFQLSIDVRHHFPNENVLRHAYNELIIRPWPDDIPLSLPLEAFISIDEGLPQARYVQQDYQSTTGRFLPLIRVDTLAAAGKVFVYVPDDQIAALSAAVPVPSGALSAAPRGGALTGNSGPEGLKPNGP